MTTGTQLQIIPADMKLPAHLQTEEAVRAIAEYNAAAAGGIKIGGFPRISIKGGKFHIVEGGETTTIMAPPQLGPDGKPVPNQPALPLMVLESVIVNANPALSKTYYEGEYQPGDDHEPTCSSDDGVTPDAHIVNKQSPSCAICPKNAWGSKVSKFSGKDVKACQDNKRLAMVPVRDLNYKALALNVTPSALGGWGLYVKALSDRNIPVNAVVTNVTFDATVSHPKNLFSFSRMLTAEEYAKVQERLKGDDVKNITSPVRQAAVPRLPAPAPEGSVGATITLTPEQRNAALGGIEAEQRKAAPAPTIAPAITLTPVTGFGAAATAPIAPTIQTPAPEVPKRTRAPRKPAEGAPAQDTLSHLPPEVRATINLLGADSELGKALLAKYPAPLASAPTVEPNQAIPPTAGSGVQPTGAGPAPGVSAAALSLKAKLEARLKQGQAATAGSN